MARIVDTDNFGGDYPDEKFLLWPMRVEHAEKIAEILKEWIQKGEFLLGESQQPLPSANPIKS